MKNILNVLIKCLKQLFRIFGFFHTKKPKESEKRECLEKTEELEDAYKGETKEREIVKTTEIEPVTEVGEIPKKQDKPHIKKSPISTTESTTEKEQIEGISKKPPASELGEIIYLGIRKRIQQKRTVLPQTTNFAEEKSDVAKEVKEIAVRVESPCIETNLDYKEKVYLILPRQKFNVDIEEDIPPYVNYKLRFNNKESEIRAKVIVRNNYAEVEEQKICLWESLTEFEVVFPVELQRKVQRKGYGYIHENNSLYIFATMGDGQGRMLYNPAQLPKKTVWILLEEKCDLASEPDNIEEQWIIERQEQWIWEKYRPILVDLRKVNVLVVRNKEASTETKLICEPAFYLEGEQSVEDDFKSVCPLFTGKTLKIIAPRENPQGWNVWVQNRVAGSKLVSENWTGREPFVLILAEDLPCSAGEFQVDICQQDTADPDDTLFFRWIPYIELNYPKELILPDSKLGHKSLLVTIVLDESEIWELKDENGQEIKPTKGNLFEFKIDSKEDKCQFFVEEKGKSETAVKICATIPRLRWRTSKQKDWQDKMQFIQRSQLVTGELLSLLICTNYFNNKYDVSAVLEKNGQKLQGPEKFIQKNKLYILELNQFYETIKHYRDDELTIAVEIRRAREVESVRRIEPLHIKPEPKVRNISELNLDDLIKGIYLPKICFLLRQIRKRYTTEKQNSKEIRNIYYNKLRKRQSNKDKERYKKEFVIKSMAFLKFVMDKYSGFRIKNQDKWREKINLFQELIPEEFDSSYKTFDRS